MVADARTNTIRRALFGSELEHDAAEPTKNLPNDNPRYGMQETPTKENGMEIQKFLFEYSSLTV